MGLVRANEDTGQADPGNEDDRSRWERARSRRRQRFLERYERRHAERQAGRHHPLKRPVRVTSGVVLVLGGVAIGWLPGPGFVVLAFPGALLIASEWRRAALLMDRVEDETIPRVRLVRARLFGGPRDEWVEEHPHLWSRWYDRRAGMTPDTGERRRADDLPDEDDAAAS